MPSLFARAHVEPKRDNRLERLSECSPPLFGNALELGLGCAGRKKVVSKSKTSTAERMQDLISLLALLVCERQAASGPLLGMSRPAAHCMSKLRQCAIARHSLDLRKKACGLCVSFNVAVFARALSDCRIYPPSRCGSNARPSPPRPLLRLGCVAFSR